MMMSAPNSHARKEGGGEGETCINLGREGGGCWQRGKGTTIVVSSKKKTYGLRKNTFFYKINISEKKKRKSFIIFFIKL